LTWARSALLTDASTTHAFVVMTTIWALEELALPDPPRARGARGHGSTRSAGRCPAARPPGRGGEACSGGDVHRGDGAADRRGHRRAREVLLGTVALGRHRGDLSLRGADLRRGAARGDGGELGGGGVEVGLGHGQRGLQAGRVDRRQHLSDRDLVADGDVDRLHRADRGEAEVRLGLRLDRPSRRDRLLERLDAGRDRRGGARGGVRGPPGGGPGAHGSRDEKDRRDDHDEGFPPPSAPASHGTSSCFRARVSPTRPKRNVCISAPPPLAPDCGSPVNRRRAVTGAPRPGRTSVAAASGRGS